MDPTTSTSGACPPVLATMANPESRRAALRAALCCGVALAAIAALLTQSAGKARPEADSLAVRKALLHRQVQQLAQFTTQWGATSIGNKGTESGNLGKFWNYGQNFGGEDADSPTQHDGGVGMFGEFGVDAPNAVSSLAPRKTPHKHRASSPCACAACATSNLLGFPCAAQWRGV